MQRYFIDIKFIDKTKQTAVIDGKDYHHIKDVMRMKIGDRIILLTNNDYEYLCEITDLNGYVSLKIIEEKINVNELQTQVTIAQGLVRKDKIEEVVRRLVELGAWEYLNVKMERCNISLKSKDDYKLTRLETIVKEASEQAERGKLLSLKGYYTFNQFLEYAKEYDYRFICYENEGRCNSHNINKYLDKIFNKKVLFIVGPEGGFSSSEVDILLEHNFIPIGLGKRILRTETAPLMVMSIISAYSDFKGEKNEN